MVSFDFKTAEVAIGENKYVKVREMSAGERRIVSRLDSDDGLYVEARVCQMCVKELNDMDPEEILDKVPGTILDELFAKVMSLSGNDEAEVEKN